MLVASMGPERFSSGDGVTIAYLISVWKQASMGPERFSSGDDAMRYRGPAKFWLQWGRSGLAPETRLAM